MYHNPICNAIRELLLICGPVGRTAKTNCYLGPAEANGLVIMEPSVGRISKPSADLESARSNI